jgi:hypothetical protein
LGPIFGSLRRHSSPGFSCFLNTGKATSAASSVSEATQGKSSPRLPIGEHVDATAFDPETKLIFNSNGEGSVTVIHQDAADKYSAVETVKTLPRAKTMASDPKTHQLYLSTAESG